MRRLISTALCAAAIACSGGSSRTLVLLHTNDEHSHVLGIGPEVDDFPAAQTAGSGAIKGGMSRRAAVFATERDRAQKLGGASLTVSAGDNMMDTLVQVGATTASADFRLMKLVGYDVTTFGNHEFDFGPNGLAKAVQVAMANEGMVPTVASNIHFSGGAGDANLAALFDETGKDATKPIHRKLVVTASNGLKVGFLGIVGVQAAQVAPFKAPVKFSTSSCCDESNSAASLAAIYSDLQPLVDSLHRDDGVDVVVLLSHSGVDLETVQNGEDYQIAKNVKGIDVIVSGHTHTKFPATLVQNDATQRQVLIQQAGAFGQFVGRVQLTVDANKNVSFDTANSLLVPVDDTLPSGDPRLDQFTAGFISALETTKVVPLAPNTPPALSFLEYTLTEIEGGDFHHPVLDDATKVGDLYFRTEGQTAFDIPGPPRAREAQATVLAADAELWAAENMGSGHADAAFFANGALRSDLLKGKTGKLAFADIFRVVPLGASPVTSTPGYPLCKFALALAELKGAFDLVAANLAQQGPNNSIYFIVPAGMKIEFDLSRPAFNPAKDPLDPANGRVTRISIAHDHTGGVYETYDQVIYDAAHLDAQSKPDPFFGGTGAALSPVVLVSNLYVATLSYVGGVRLRNPATGAPYASPTDSIIHRADGTEIKDWEALAGYIRSQSAANGGTLPSRYNPAVSTGARRAVCVGASCG